MEFDIKDINLAEEGKLSVEWANKSMPVLNIIKERFQKEKCYHRDGKPRENSQSGWCRGLALRLESPKHTGLCDSISG